MQFSNSSILPDTEKYIFIPFPRFAVQSIAIASVSLRVQKSPLVKLICAKESPGTAACPLFLRSYPFREILFFSFSLISETFGHFANSSIWSAVHWLSSFVQKNPQGLQRVHYFFPRARLDLQFLTICVHIGYICKKIRLGATVIG